MRLELRTENVSPAALVRQQVPDLHLGRHIGVRIIGRDLADRIVERKLAMFDQLKRRDRREHFVHRTDAEPRVERVVDSCLAIRLAPGEREE